MLGLTALQSILVLLPLLTLVALRALLFRCWINYAHQAESKAEVARLKHNDFVMKHNAMKNQELWNSILSQFLSIMCWCLMSKLKLRIMLLNIHCILLAIIYQELCIHIHVSAVGS